MNAGILKELKKQTNFLHPLRGKRLRSAVDKAQNKNEVNYLCTWYNENLSGQRQMATHKKNRSQQHST